MKKLLLIMSFCCAVNIAQAQSTHFLQDASHNPVGYFQADGTILDASSVFKGQIKRDPTAPPSTFRQIVLDGHRSVIGYINNNTEFQNASHTTIGYIRRGADFQLIIEDASHNVVGYVNNEVTRGGTVENASHTVVGYKVKAEPINAAAYFFMYHF